MSDFPKQGYQPVKPTGLPETGPPAPPCGGSGLTGIKHLEKPIRPETLGSDSMMLRYIGDAIVFLAEVMRSRA